MSEVSKNQKPMDFVGKLKERIKEQFLDVVPDEEWDRLIKSEIESFFKPQSNITIEVKEENASGWGGQKTYKTSIRYEDGAEISPFTTLVYEQCFKKLSDKLASELTEEYFNVNFDEGVKQAGIEKVVEKMAPQIITQFFTGVMGSSVYNIQNEIIKMKGDLSSQGFSFSSYQ